MLVQLYRDNYTTVPTENLITTIYNGFFDGVENWFLTADVANTDLRTSDLTNLNTITKGQFNSSIPQSIIVSGFFRARKTGTYKFFTYSNDKNILEIDGDDIIVNDRVNFFSFATKSLIAGRYYPINLYYGNKSVEYPPAPMTANTTTILGQTYVASASTEFDEGFLAFEAFNDVTNETFDRWRSNSSVYSSTTGNHTSSNPISETSIDGVIRKGEWLQIELPYTISLDTFSLTCREDNINKGAPKSFYIAGSNNLSGTWSQVYFDDNLTWSGLETKTFTTTNKTGFKYFRCVVLSIYSPSFSSGGTFTALNEWKLFAPSNEPALECGYLEPDESDTPDTPLTGDTTTLSDGEYNVTISNQGPSTREKWFAFDKIIYSTNRAETIGGVYTKTIDTFNNYYSDSGNATTNIIGEGIYRGEWLQLELPNPKRIKHFKITRRTDTNTGLINLFVFLGSNDPDSGWNKLYEESTPSNTFWDITNNRELKSFDVNQNENEYKYYRIAVHRTQGGSGFHIGELLLYTENYTRDATGLTTYYDINPETQPIETTQNYPLVMEDDTLQGFFRISPLALYLNRTSFTTSKSDILYVASEELFNNFNGTYKNYIQLHEKPIAGDNERKRFTQFSDDMSFECELNGRIEVRFRRGNFEPITWRYAMLILDVERIPVKKI